jgi:hypothetical protein
MKTVGYKEDECLFHVHYGNLGSTNGQCQRIQQALIRCSTVCELPSPDVINLRITPTTPNLALILFICVNSCTSLRRSLRPTIFNEYGLSCRHSFPTSTVRNLEQNGKALIQDGVSADALLHREAGIIASDVHRNAKVD